MLTSSILILITERREQVIEFWGLFISFLFLTFHSVVEVWIFILIPVDQKYEIIVQRLLSASIPALIFGIWGTFVTISQILGKEWRLADLFLAMSIGIGATTAFFSIRVNAVDGGWRTSLKDPIHSLVIGLPIIVTIVRIIWMTIPAMNRERTFVFGWTIMGLTILLLILERLFEINTIVFGILYPAGIFLLSISIFRNPLVFFLRDLKPQYLLIINKTQGTVVFEHYFGERLPNLLPSAIEASMEILAETAGSEKLPNRVKFLGKVVTNAESENYLCYLFSNYSNFSVERKLREILQELEQMEVWDGTIEKEIEEKLEFFKRGS